MRVNEIMSNDKSSRTKITVNENENIDNAALLMKENRLNKITVIDDNNKVVGTITSDCIVKCSEDLNADFFLD